LRFTLDEKNWVPCKEEEDGVVKFKKKDVTKKGLHERDILRQK